MVAVQTSFVCQPLVILTSMRENAVLLAAKAMLSRLLAAVWAVKKAVVIPRAVANPWDIIHVTTLHPAPRTS